MDFGASLSAEEVRYAAGCGNWRFFRKAAVPLDDVYASAAHWAAELKGVTKPWLCWNVDPDWCLVQQRLVKSVGWTPVVGHDPRAPFPRLEAGAIFIDFNKHLKLPVMWMHFPLEFVHLYAERLAFWHADCLLRTEKMRKVATIFEGLPDGAMAAVKPKETTKGILKDILRSSVMRAAPSTRRYWEVVGCTTRGASKNAFDNGCGWWMGWAFHPSNSEQERARKLRYYWDSGSGIRFWHKKLGHQVELIPESYIAEGHFTSIGRSGYKHVTDKNFKRNLSLELSLNNELVECCDRLDLEKFLE